MDTFAIQPLLYFNLYSIPPLITSVTALWLGLKVSYSSPTKLNQLFLGWCICVFVWLFSYSICYSTTDESLAVLLSEFACTGVLFFATTFYHFLLVFLNRKKEIVFVKIGYLLNIVMMPIAFSTNHILSGVQKLFFGYYVIASNYYWVLLVIFFGYLLRSQYLIIITVLEKKLPPHQHAQTQYFLLAMSIAYFSVSDFLPKYGIIFYPFGSILIFVWILIMAYTLMAKELQDIREVLRRWLPYLIPVGIIIIITLGVIIFNHVHGGKQ